MANRLSATFVRTVKRPGVYGDGHGGHGLSLSVRPRADGGVRKAWVQRLRMPSGQVTTLGVGPFPVVTLAEARAAALENRRTVWRGDDPRASGAVTFAEAAAAVIAQRSQTWRDPRSPGQWTAMLETYAFQRIGGKPVGEVTSQDILGVVSPLWSVKRETARKLLGRIRAVIAWAVAEGHRTDDPTAVVATALPQNGRAVKHHKALPAWQVAEAVAAVQASSATESAKACFEYIAVTGVRSGEARLATWAEIDLEAATWEIPAERHKSSRGLRVPLSGRALAILREAAKRAGGQPRATSLVFAAATGRPLSDGTLSKLLRELGVGTTPHGMRSSMRTWCAEAGYPREVCEAALGHALQGTEAAYMHGDHLEARRPMAEAWAIAILPV